MLEMQKLKIVNKNDIKENSLQYIVKVCALAGTQHYLKIEMNKIIWTYIANLV